MISPDVSGPDILAADHENGATTFVLSLELHTAAAVELLGD